MNKEDITLINLSNYQDYEYIKVIPHQGKEMKYCISNCINDFNITKFYKKDIENLWINLEEELLEDTYLNDEDKSILLSVFNGEKEYCWLIDYTIDGHNYNDICYIEDTEIQNQNDIDKWIMEILDWVYQDYSSWELVA